MRSEKAKRSKEKLSRSNRCPRCLTWCPLAVDADGFMKPAEWQFWGEKGKRWIACKGYGYVHFQVEINGGRHNRVAYYGEGGDDSDGGDQYEQKQLL